MGIFVGVFVTILEVQVIDYIKDKSVELSISICYAAIASSHSTAVDDKYQITKVTPSLLLMLLWYFKGRIRHVAVKFLKGGNKKGRERAAPQENTRLANTS